MSNQQQKQNNEFKGLNDVLQNSIDYTNQFIEQNYSLNFNKGQERQQG